MLYIENIRKLTGQQSGQIIGRTMRDDDETIGLFEPLMVGEGSPKRAELNDQLLALLQANLLALAEHVEVSHEHA